MKKRARRISLIKSVPKGSFKLPIQTVTLVPSTTSLNKKVYNKTLAKRVNDTRKLLSRLFGGYTSTRATGGYVAKKGSLVKEKVVLVVSYSERKTFAKNKKLWINWLKRKKKAWGQEAIGIIIENDMFYI